MNITTLSAILCLLLLSVATSFSPIQHRPLLSSRTTQLSVGAVTIEREDTAVAPPVVEEIRAEPTNTERKGQRSETWEVRIYNDGLNTREHVARALVTVTGIPEVHAYRTMMHAHTNGMAPVGRWVYEVAELYHDALREKGIICDIVPVDEEQ